MDKNLELRRKLVHLFFGILLVALIFYDLVDKLSLGIAAVFVFLFFLFSRHIKIEIIEWLLKKFERREVRKAFPGKGIMFYLLGSELSLVFFEKNAAIAAILILAIGDSIPNFVGMHYKGAKHSFSNKKFLEAALAGIVASFLAAMIFVRWYEALAASIVAIFLEGIDMKIGLEKIDDNLIVPLSAGIVISLIRWLM